MINQDYKDTLGNHLTKIIEKHTNPCYFISMQYNIKDNQRNLLPDRVKDLYDIDKVRKTHKHLSNLLRSAFGQIGMFWFNERNPDKIENDKVLQGYYHSHLILETIQDYIFEDPNRFLKKIYYQGSNPIIDRRYPNDESRNYDIIKAVLKQAEWLKVPNKKSINIKPIQDLKSLFVNPNEPNNGYLLKDLDRLGINIIIDKENSSF
jgi:hypothetical protein